ncbi:hypothetical protein CUMW_224830 [Citrus unshiu]|uniref:Uncharacterized protein n=1 Tax=Citrus unshiu TaxID=55188 RepID=A0A2H5QFJ5_CITUN|nr:hypothetical protein CUMW_224830 [Citrus unshiu]
MCSFQIRRLVSSLNLLYYVLAVAVSEVTCLYLFASELRTPTFARDLENHLKTLSKLDKLQDALAPTPYSQQRKTCLLDAGYAKANNIKNYNSKTNFALIQSAVKNDANDTISSWS